MYRNINALFCCIFIFYQLEGQINLSFTTQDASCSGKGSIQVLATGGKEPYNYEITENNCGLNNKPLQSSPTFSGLTSCTYTVRVIDAEGRTGIKNAVVGGNYIGPSASIQVEGCGFVINTKNGNAPISYSISTDGGISYGPATSQNIFNGLANGMYYIKIEDACNSVFISSATISIDTLEYNFFRLYRNDLPTDSITPINIRGGHGPFQFAIINDRDTLRGINNIFALKDIVKTCSTKVMVLSLCGRFINTFTYVDAEIDCINYSNGTAEFKVNLGTAPYTSFFYESNSSVLTFSGLSMIGLPKNEPFYYFNLKDKCNHYASGVYGYSYRLRPEFNFVTATSCNNLESVRIEILNKNYYLKSNFTIECSSCIPVQRFNNLEKFTTINNLNPGKKTILIRDSCGTEWTCSSEIMIPVTETCESISLKLVNAFRCNNRPDGSSFSGDTIQAEMYYIRNVSGTLIDSNTQGYFTNLTNGQYIIQAKATTCGLIQGSYLRNIVVKAPTYGIFLERVKDKCQTHYTLNVENTYYPYTLTDTSGNLITNTSPDIQFGQYFFELKPGKYILKSLLNCWQNQIDLPEIKPKIKLENITICPAGGSIRISGGNSHKQWIDYFTSLNHNLYNWNNAADWYSLSSRSSKFNYDTATHTYFNIEPGKTYVIYMHSFASIAYNNEDNNCPIDSLTFTAPVYTPPSLLSDLTLKCDQFNTVLNQLKIRNGTSPYQIQEINCTNQSNIGNSISTSDTVLILSTNSVSNHCYKVTDVCQNSSTTESSIGDLNSNIQVLKNCNATTTFYFSPIPGASYTWRNKQNIVIGNQSSVTTPDPKTGDEVKLSLSYRGCTIAKSIVIDDLTARVFDVRISGDKGPDICFGDSIRLSASISGGIGPFQYKWSNGSHEDQILVKKSGVLTLEVTNGLGCRDTAMLSVRVGDVLSLKSNTQSIACFGEKTGKIALKPSGGIQPFQYQWTHGPTLDSLSGLPAGSYTVSVTDAAGCRITENFILEENPKLSFTTQTSPSTCGVSKDGFLEVNPSGGAYGYNFRWNTGQTSNRLTNLNPGIYTITVTDQALCQQVASLEVLRGPEIFNQRSDTICSGTSLRVGTSVYSVTGQFRDTLKTSQGCDSIVSTRLTVMPFEARISTDRSTDLCAGDSIRLNALLAGGISPFTFSWTNGSRSQGNWVHTTGSHVLKVVDFLGCEDTAMIQIRIGEPLSLLNTSTSIACFGDSTGSIKIRALGGIGPYRYLWSTGSVSDSLTQLAAGSYEVTLTDAAGCMHQEKYLLDQNPRLTLNTRSLPSTCGVSRDGSAEAIPAGGAPGYTYRWNTGATTGVLRNINPGNYTVTVTDLFACQTIATVAVAVGPQIISQRIDTICAGSTLRIGNSTYSVSGNFRDTLRTSQGCDSIVLTRLTVNPFEVSVNTNKQTDLCAGDSLLLTAVLIGGLAPFNYSWTNGSQASSAWIKTSGQQMVTVRDRLGCQDTANLGIRIGEPIKISNTSNPIACFGDSTGSIEVQTSGGLGAHRYLWSTGTMTDRISGLPAGQYGITVTDAANCILSENFNLNQNPKLTLIPKAFQATCGVSKDGAAEIMVSGGASGYSYTWSSGQNTARLNNINPGNYSVTVTDQALCKAHINIEVPRAPQIMSQRTDTLCAGKTIRIGNSVYTTSGNFRDTLKTFQGCDSIVLTSLTVNPTLQYILDVKDPQCHGESNGSIAVSGLNSKPPYSFELNGRAINGFVAQNLASGNYTIKITDGFGCITEKGVALTNPRKLELDAGRDTILQFGDSIQLKALTNLSPAEIKSLKWTSDQGLICNQCSTATLRPRRDLAIRVELENTAGCKIIDQFLVKINLEFKVFAPNVIYLDPASSGTGLNSRFTLFSNQIQAIKYLRIFDRFGSLLFEVKNIPPGDINSGWDGTYRGHRVNPGVYVYLAMVKFADESVKVVSGDVTVLN